MAARISLEWLWGKQHQRRATGVSYRVPNRAGKWSALAFILLSSEEELDQFELSRYCASEKVLLRLLPVVKASTKALLSRCELSDRSCGALASVLSSQSSSLRVLDLSLNDLKDSGLKLLSDGLKSPHCKLETLSLSGCLVSEEGCASLASALRSNPSHLRELDLSYNHPGDTGVKLLSALLEDPHCTLHTLRLEHSGAQRLTPGPRKYLCDLTLDPNSAHTNLKLSDNNKKSWSSSSGTVGVFVDCPAGSLSFYTVSSEGLIHLHTFSSTFSQSLVPGFGLWTEGSSVSLCPGSE
uniref:B30.2/SPRY domain-containing protein n=1 Tax=Knipowitschia caucasica TaxID=637954 RepID=A0AAV2LJW3_KNICA